jgi:hypothetical protein
MTRALAFAVVVIVTLAVRASAGDVVDALGADDPHAVESAVTAIERAPTTPDLAGALFAAGRACEDKLIDPVRALAIYERIVRELPTASVAGAAERRALRLREQIGAAGEHAREAAALARLIADADHLPFDDVSRQATALAAAAWPGAPDVALWFAEWLQRTARFDAAQQRYADVLARWPGTRHAELARREAAGCAIDARDWSLAERLARELSSSDPADVAIRDEILDAAARGRLRDRLYAAAWLALGLALAGLLASLIEATLRGGRRFPAARPPVEVLFLAPVGAVIVLASFTAHRAIAPAVTRITLVGLALAWLSGATLDLLRARGRSLRARSIVHVAACAVGVIAIGYIAMTRDGLVDLLAETVKFGPE